MFQFESKDTVVKTRLITNNNTHENIKYRNVIISVWSLNRAYTQEMLSSPLGFLDIIPIIWYTQNKRKL